MRAKPFVLALQVGLVSAAIWFAPGCGSDLDNQQTTSGSGSGGSGGESSATATSTTATTTATTATTATTTTTTTSTTTSTGSGAMCGPNTCGDVDLMGFLTLEGCCDEINVENCGIDLSPAAGFIKVPPGCTELDQPGDVDPSCPDLSFNVMGFAVDFVGCCLPSAMCGVVADISLIGVNFGCVDAADFSDTPPPPQACGGGTGGAGGSGGSGGSGGMGMGGAGGSGGS